MGFVPQLEDAVRRIAVVDCFAVSLLRDLTGKVFLKYAGGVRDVKSKRKGQMV